MEAKAPETPASQTRDWKELLVKQDIDMEDLKQFIGNLSPSDAEQIIKTVLENEEIFEKIVKTAEDLEEIGTLCEKIPSAADDAQLLGEFEKVRGVVGIILREDVFFRQLVKNVEDFNRVTNVLPRDYARLVIEKILKDNEHFERIIKNPEDLMEVEDSRYVTEEDMARFRAKYAELEARRNLSAGATISRAFTGGGGGAGSDSRASAAP